LAAVATVAPVIPDRCTTITEGFEPAATEVAMAAFEALLQKSF
jgi:hypothetical protein